KASRRGLCAIHRYDEDSIAACRIDGIPIAIALQYAVLHGDGGQFACSYPEKCPPRRSRLIVQNAKGLAATLRGQQTNFSRMQIFFPALRADHVAEQRFIVAAPQTVASGFLLIGPTYRKIREAFYDVVDDCGVAHCGSDDLVAATA